MQCNEEGPKTLHLWLSQFVFPLCLLRSPDDLPDKALIKGLRTEIKKELTGHLDEVRRRDRAPFSHVPLFLEIGWLSGNKGFTEP